MTLLSAAATARAVTVLLLRPAHPSAAAAEAIVRLRGELLAAGYTVVVADLPEHGGVRAAMEPPARPAGADAVVALFGDDPEGPGALSVVDRATGKTVSRPIPHDAEGERSAQILSVRALELLRASFLEAALAPPVPAAPPAPKNTATAVAAAKTVPRAEAAPAVASGTPPARTAAEPAAAPAAPEPAPVAPPRRPSPEPTQVAASVTATAAPARTHPRVFLEAGGLALGSFDGMPPAVLPLVRLAATPSARWPLLIRLSAAGLGTRARVSDAQGAAEVSHQLALAEALWAFRAGHRWQPFVSLGAGAAHVSADGVPVMSGSSVAPAIGRSATTWAFVADAGAGLRVNLGQRLHVAGEVHAQGDAPSPAIRFLGDPLASEGRPTWLTSVSVGMGL